MEEETEMGEEAARIKRDREGEMERGAVAAGRRKKDPATEEWKKQMMAESRQRAKEESNRYMVNFQAKYPNEAADWSDLLAIRAREYRDHWEEVWGDLFGSFETSTPIPAMRFTDGPLPTHATTNDALQIVSVSIKEVKQGVKWPLQVYGIIAARDPVDRNRNIIFNRERDNCQILTPQDPSLLLTGPTRAVVFCDPVEFEVALKLKGSAESEDKDLSLLTVTLADSVPIVQTCLIYKKYTSKLSTLALKFSYVVESVEATISVHVMEGSWPDDVYCNFSVVSSNPEYAYLLLGCKNVAVGDDGMIKLSRRVASVEFKRDLKVSVTAFQYDDHGKKSIIGTDEEGFTPKKAGKSLGTLNVSFCKMDVTVAWSLTSLVPKTQEAPSNNSVELLVESG